MNYNNNQKSGNLHSIEYINKSLRESGTILKILDIHSERIDKIKKDMDSKNEYIKHLESEVSQLKEQVKVSNNSINKFSNLIKEFGIQMTQFRIQFGDVKCAEIIDMDNGTGNDDIVKAVCGNAPNEP
jgi:septal ring factor EnvC (AmiA/AmiB activator)